jgi:succinate dehydrogenase hydrophobic anchor subunit
MHDYTTKEKLKITAGAVCALVIVGWLAVFALAILSTLR